MPRKPRRPTNVVEMLGRGMATKRQPKRGRFPWGTIRLFILTLSLVFVAGISATNWHRIADKFSAMAKKHSTDDAPGNPSSTELVCNNPYVIDGDTIDCGGERVRLASIDAPEMPGHCRPGRDCTPGDPYAARDELSRLVQHGVTCRRKDTDSYGRTIATCAAGGVDLSCAMVSSGHAVQRYGMLFC